MTTLDIIKSYPYIQFSDDENIVALFDAYNQYAQQYLDWFNDTPLAIYTNSNISGSLLDWVGQGIYGVYRTPIAHSLSKSNGPLNTYTANEIPLNEGETFSLTTSVAMTDDIYKRLITWDFYKGDGMQLSIPWMKRRIARFVFQDTSPETIRNISVKIGANKLVSIVIEIETEKAIIASNLNSIINQELCNWPIGYGVSFFFLDSLILNNDFGGDIA